MGRSALRDVECNFHYKKCVRVERLDYGIKNKILRALRIFEEFFKISSLNNNPPVRFIKFIAIMAKISMNSLIFKR